MSQTCIKLYISYFCNKSMMISQFFKECMKNTLLLGCSYINANQCSSMIAYLKFERTEMAKNGSSVDCLYYTCFRAFSMQSYNNIFT